MTRQDDYTDERKRKRHGAAPGVRSPRKRRAGARRGSAPLAVLLALVMALAFPARAFASVYNNPIVTWTSLQSCYVCGPNNEFDAALAIIERTNTKIQISEPMYVELSNEGTGGRFYQLAKSLKCAADEMPSTSDFVLSASVSAGVALYGADYVWWQHGITANDELVSGALQDYETILNGGHLGGGGDNDADYWNFTVKTLYTTNSSYEHRFTVDGVGYTNYYKMQDNNMVAARDGYQLAPQSFDVRISKAFYSNASAVETRGFDSGFVNIKASNAYFALANSDGVEYTESTQTINGATHSVYGRVRITTQHYRNGSNGVWYQNGGIGCSDTSTRDVSFNGSVLQFDVVGTVPATDLSLASANSGAAYLTDPYLSGLRGAGNNSGGGGDNNWPGPTDEPEPGPPEPPREPDPIPRDPIDWPQPYNPTTPAPGPEPTPTTPVTNPTNTSPADYTPWLMAILSELRGIHTDMNAWLDAIFEGIVDYGAAICSHIDTASENVRSTLRFMTQWMDEQLDASFYALRHLLWECANYIADSLDYTFVGPDVNLPGYDDSSVLYWLKRIYYKLGSGNVNTRPVDPVGDHDNWWDWIVQLIKNLILDLGMMGADFLSDMGDVLSEVMQKFPFSIPWDIAAYLTAFSTQPVTPVIVITMPAISGFLPQTQFTIDLHPYDDAMATVRAVEVIVFTFWLMWKCPILLDMMDTAKWGI